jgi:histone acetyltransferase 1
VLFLAFSKKFKLTSIERFPMTTMDEQQEAKRRKLEALEAKMGGAPPPQATRPAKMPELPALKPTQPTPAEAAPPTTDASEEEARSPFVCDANDVVQFRLVRTEADMDAAEVFEPEFTHQIFRDDETIFGYRDLVVKISMSANLFKTLVEISYAEKVKSVLNPADDITAMLKRHLGDDVFTDRAAFIATLKADAAAPVPSAGGEIVSTWETVGDDGVTYVDTARVFRLSDDDVYPWHARFEPMILFYIDGASAIDSEDTKWLLFAVTRARADDSTKWSLTSFATVYEFFVYPGATRARLSQIVVLPPYQRKGLGGKMLESVRAYSKMKEFAGRHRGGPDAAAPTASRRVRRARDVRGAGGDGRGAAVRDGGREAAAGRRPGCGEGCTRDAQGRRGDLQGLAQDLRAAGEAVLGGVAVHDGEEGWRAR